MKYGKARIKYDVVSVWEWEDGTKFSLSEYFGEDKNFAKRMQETAKDRYTDEWPKLVYCRMGEIEIRHELRERMG